MGRVAADARRHQAAGAAKNQRLAGKAIVEDDGAVDVRNAALVGAVPDAPVHAFEDAPGVEQATRQAMGVVGGCEAQNVGIEQQPAPHSGAEWVAVHAQNAGDRAAVRVQGGRRVVGLHLHDQVPVVVEGDDPGVVVEHRAQPVDPLRDLLGRRHDVALEEAPDGRARSVLVLVIDRAPEDLVLAVLRPRLRQGLQLDVGGGPPDAALPPVRLALRIAEIRLDGFHFRQVQGQEAFPAEAHQGVVVQVQGNRTDLRRPVGARNRRRQERLRSVAPVGRRRDPPAVHQGVGQKIPHQALHAVVIQVAREQVQVGGVDLPVYRSAEHVLEPAQGRAADVVRDPGQQADLDDPAARRRGPLVPARFLRHRVREQRLTGGLQLRRREGGTNGVEGGRRRAVDRAAGVLPQAAQEGLAAPVATLRQRTDDQMGDGLHGFRCFFAACTKARKSGCGRRGRESSSGWYCVATKNGCAG